MIDKIKKEIEKERECMEQDEYSEQELEHINSIEAYEKCLKWAEELEKELKKPINLSFCPSKFTEKQMKEKIEKAFRGENDNSPQSVESDTQEFNENVSAVDSSPQTPAGKEAADTNDEVCECGHHKPIHNVVGKEGCQGFGCVCQKFKPKSEENQK
jgi:hypothetical protein